MENLYKLKTLVEKIIAIHEKNEHKQNNLSGENFNIFRILHLNHSEVAVCRFLAELLSTTGSHGQYAEFLARFFRDVLHFEPDVTELKSARIYREFTLSDSRRIDIVIETLNYFLPIEVKIYATDQPGQTADYWKAAKQRQLAPEPKVYYLTLHGNEPSEESRRKLPKENIVCLSFEKDILLWLENILDDKNLNISANVLWTIRQFSAAIKEWTHIMENKEREEMIAFLTKSVENICTINKAASVLNDAKSCLLPLILTDIANKIDEEFYHILGHNLDITHLDVSEKSVQDFYNSPKNVYAHIGIYYICRDVELGEDYELQFAIVVETNLYCQYLIYDCKTKKHLDNIPSELLSKVQEYFNESLESSDNIHPDWEYLPLLPNRPYVNLRDRELMDEEILSLFDSEKRSVAVDRIVPVIGKMLKKMNV